MIKITDVSKGHSTSIVKIKEFQKELNSCVRSTLNLEKKEPSKTSVTV